MTKPKRTQKENLESVSGRDLFQTPNYATDLLVPFLQELVPMSPSRRFRIWECAAGQGKIVDRLEHWRFDIFGSDLQGTPSKNFLYDDAPIAFDCIVTNPPFSLKRKFYERCRQIDLPFALLIPADYSGWIIKAIRDGAEKIIPTRRIDYITPTGKESHAQFHSMWLAWRFGIGKTETFVELTNEMKNNI